MKIEVGDVHAPPLTPGGFFVHQRAIGIGRSGAQKNRANQIGDRQKNDERCQHLMQGPREIHECRHSAADLHLARGAQDILAEEIDDDSGQHTKNADENDPPKPRLGNLPGASDDLAPIVDVLCNGAIESIGK